MERPDKSRLIEFKPNKAYLVGVDSDGCVFDNMGIKQDANVKPEGVRVGTLKKVLIRDLVVEVTG